LAGDFNSNLLSESHLVDNFKSLGLFSVNETFPTHYSSHCDTLLDLFLINDPRKIIHYDQVSVPAFSGHDLIFLTYDLTFDSKINSFTYRDYKNINYNELKTEFLCSDWSCIYHLRHVNCQLQVLTNDVQYLINKFVPLRTKVIKPIQNPWFSSEIKNLTSQRDVAYLRWKRYKTDEFRKQYKEARVKVNKMIKSAKKEHYNIQFNHCVNSKNRWNKLKRLGIGK